MMRSALLSACLVIGVGAAACSSTQSSDVPTNNITATFHVDVDADPAHPRMHINGFLVEGDKGVGSTGIHLSDGDALFASTDKEKDVFMERVLDNQYAVANDIQASDRTDVTIALKRANGGNAPGSTIHLIPPANFTAPALGASIPYAAGAGTVDVAWTKAPGAKMTFVIKRCGAVSLSSITFDLDDTGKSSLSTSKLVDSAPTAPTCVTIELARIVNNGILDPSLRKGGTFDATRYDHLDVTVVP
jgi:hypothetical protein